MTRYVIQGRYSTEGMKGMLAHPTDREAATRALIEATGGRLVLFLVTTGDTDFLLVVESDSSDGLLAGLLVSGASGSVASLRTVQAFTAAEFMAAQKQAQAIAASYRAPA